MGPYDQNLVASSSLTEDKISLYIYKAVLSLSQIFVVLLFQKLL